jgi:hypothetical protein
MLLPCCQLGCSILTSSLTLLYILDSVRLTKRALAFAFLFLLRTNTIRLSITINFSLASSYPNAVWLDI